jgi:hypothetical protein
MFKINFESNHIEIFYRKSKDYFINRPINCLFVCQYNYHYTYYSDGRIGYTGEYTTNKFKENHVIFLKKIYSNVINYIKIDNTLTFHSLKKEFTFWKRYLTFKKYQKSLMFFEEFGLFKSLIDKIAWYASG